MAPYKNTRFSKKQKKNKEIPKKKPKKKKKKSYQKKILEQIPEELDNMDSEEQVDTPKNEILKPEDIVPEKKSYKTKDKDKNKRDSKIWYGRHYFEAGRKGALQRMRKGFRIRYPTLKKYKLINEYEIWTKYAIENGSSKDKIEYEKHLEMLENEKVFENRLENKVEPFVNETITQVANAMNAQNLGNGIQPENITILINSDNTPEVDSQIISFNDNFSQQNVQTKKTKTKKKKQQEEEFANASNVVSTSGIFNMDYWIKEKGKVFTMNDVKEHFESQRFGKWVKNTWKPVSAQTRKDNYDNIKKLLDILGCLKGDYRYFKKVSGDAETLSANNTPGRLISRITKKPIPLKDPNDNTKPNPDYYKRTEAEKAADKKLYWGRYTRADGSEDILECFAGDEETIRQKIELIVQTPNRKDGKAPGDFNKQIISTIQSLAREQFTTQQWHSPFRHLIGIKRLKMWEEGFDTVMDRWRNQETEGLSETGKLVSLPWRKIMEALQSLRNKFLEAKKTGNILAIAKANLDYVLWACISLKPPVRDDYGECRLLKGGFEEALDKPYKPRLATIGGRRIIKKGSILEKDKKYKEYLNHYSIKEETFSFQRYKTMDRYLQRRYKLSELKQPFGYGKLLAEILKESYELVPRDWLFGKCRLNKNKDKVIVSRMKRQKVDFGMVDGVDKEQPSSRKGSLSKELIRIQKANGITTNPTPGRKLGVNILRHSMISYLYRVKKINANQKGLLANYMLHSTEQAKSYNFSLVNTNPGNAAEGILKKSGNRYVFAD